MDTFSLQACLSFRYICRPGNFYSTLARFWNVLHTGIIRFLAIDVRIFFPVLLSFIACVLLSPLSGSPRKLCKVNRTEEARETLAIIYDTEPYSDYFDEIINDIQLSLGLSGCATVRSVFLKGRQRTLN